MLKVNGHKKEILFRNRYWIALFITIIFANAFTAAYVLREKYIYYWDLTHYWDFYFTLGEKFLNSPKEAVISFASSVRNDDYNLFPALLLMPFYFLFGGSRLSFILSRTNTYMIPTVLILTLLSERVIRTYRGKMDLSVFFLNFATILLFSPIWAPLLRGYSGMLGIIFIGIILVIYFQKPLEQMGFLELVTIGVLLFLVAISRRWYMFWVVSFFISAFILRFAILVKTKATEFDKYTQLIRNISIMGVTFLTLMFIIATNVTFRMITSNYSDLYSAYKLPFIETYKGFQNNFGVLFIILSVMGILMALKEKSIKYFVLFLVIQNILMYLLFTTVQAFNIQHLLLFVPFFVIFLTVFNDQVLGFLKQVPLRFSYIAVYTLLIIFSFTLVFIPFSGRLLSLAYAFPKSRYYPLVRGDIEEIYRMIRTVESILKTDPGGSIYVLSSSHVFNASIFIYAARMENKNTIIGSHFNYTADVDKRDGFPFGFVESKYLLVAEPIQYHLQEKDQQVIGIPAYKILNKEGIGNNYKKLPYKFVLQDNVNVYVYKKVENPHYSEIKNLLREFYSLYPEWSKEYYPMPIFLMALEKNSCFFRTQFPFFHNHALCLLSL